MKRFVDQKGRTVKFGDTVHYHEGIRENGLDGYYSICGILTPNNIEKLKCLGIIKEIEVKYDIEYFENRLKELLVEQADSKFIERFKNCFPAQYLSSLITLIHDEIDDDKNLKDYGYIFNLNKGVMEKVKTNNSWLSNANHYINVFSTEETKDICLNIIKPWIDVMYK